MFFPQSFDFVSTLISKDWSPLVYSHAVSLFSFHLSETRLRPSIHRFSPTVSGEVSLSSSSTSLCFPTEYYVPRPLSITILLKDWILCEIATISREMRYDGYKLHQLFENYVWLLGRPTAKYRVGPYTVVHWTQAVWTDRYRRMGTGGEKRKGTLEKKLHNEKPHDLYTSPNIISEIKSWDWRGLWQA